MMSKDDNAEGAQLGSLSIAEIVAYLRRDVWWIFGATVMATVIAVVIALRSQETWKATMHVVPTEVPQSEQLGALAEVLSKKAGSGSANIDLFSALLVSRPVIERLLASKIVKPSPGGDSILSLRHILEVDSTDPRRVFSAINQLSKQISFAQQQSSLSSIVEVGVTAGHPWLAKGMLRNLLAIGQESLLEVNRYRYLTVIRRLESADSMAGAKAKDAADSHTRFLEENRSSSLPAIIQRGEFLRREKEIREQTYAMVRSELEQNRLNLEKIMPPVVPLDSVFVPPNRESPRRTMMVIVGFLFGMLGGALSSVVYRVFIGRTGIEDRGYRA